MRSDWRWWAKLGLVCVTAVAAVLLILIGSVRFLEQARLEHDRVECLRAGVQAQARSNATMAAEVLDARRTQAERAASFRTWADGQVTTAERIGRC